MQRLFVITCFIIIHSVSPFFFGGGGGGCSPRPSCCCCQSAPQSSGCGGSPYDQGSFAGPVGASIVAQDSRPIAPVSSNGGYAVSQSYSSGGQVGLFPSPHNSGYNAPISEGYVAQPQVNGGYLPDQQQVGSAYIEMPLNNAPALPQSFIYSRPSQNAPPRVSPFINVPQSNSVILGGHHSNNGYAGGSHHSESAVRQKEENLSEYKTEKFKAKAAKTIFVETRCNSEDLRQVLEENIIVFNANESKKRVYNAANILFTNSNERSSKYIDVICAPNPFSYRIKTEFFCEHTKGDITCFAYQQHSE